MQTISQVVAKSFSTASNARRALMATGAGQRHPGVYLVKEVDGRWVVRDYMLHTYIAQVNFKREQANAARKAAKQAAQQPAQQAPAQNVVKKNPVGVTFNRGGSKGLKIQADRVTRNGQTQPSVGGTCRKIWDWCDAYFAQNGKAPTPAVLKAWGVSEMGINPNTCNAQLAYWRNFNGMVKHRDA